jgi:hypothetical protein
MVFDFISIAPDGPGFVSRQGLWIPSCEEAIQLAYENSVFLLWYTFVSEIMHESAPDVFLHQLSWKKWPYDLLLLYCVGAT